MEKKKKRVGDKKTNLELCLLKELLRTNGLALTQYLLNDYTEKYANKIFNGCVSCNGYKKTCPHYKKSVEEVKYT